MHIAFVIAPQGGPDANVKTLAPELERRGHRISVVYVTAKEAANTDCSEPIRFRFAPPGSAHYYISKFVGGYHSWPLRLRAWEHSMAVWRALKEIDRQERIDIVEVTEGFPVAMLRRSWRVVVRAHGCDWTVRRFCENQNGDHDRWLIAQERRQFLGAHGASALSAHLAEHLSQTLRIPASGIEVIPYGIDTDKFRPNSNGHGSGPPVLLTVGRLERRKGVDTLLRAMPHVWRAYHDAQVSLIGGAAEFDQEDLRRLVPEDRQGQIVFRGFLERDQLIAEYQRATIYVAPTQYETFGYTVLEAMACGKPVISTKVGAIPELVNDNETGLLVPRDDEQALAKAIIMLLDDRESRNRMGECARNKTIASYSGSVVADRLLSLYDGVLNATAA